MLETNNFHFDSSLEENEFIFWFFKKNLTVSLKKLFIDKLNSNGLGYFDILDVTDNIPLGKDIDKLDDLEIKNLVGDLESTTSP